MSDMENRVDRELGWDDEIQHDSSFVLLPEGDYDFEVVSFERARSKGSDKLPACNMAVLTIEVGSDQAAARIKHHLLLHTRVQWKLCEFFLSIGARKHGDTVPMDWTKVVGARGRCKVGIRKWTSRNTGEEMQSNEIKKFYEPREKPPSAPSLPPQPKTYTPGAF